MSTSSAPPSGSSDHPPPLEAGPQNESSDQGAGPDAPLTQTGDAKEATGSLEPRGAREPSAIGSKVRAVLATLMLLAGMGGFGALLHFHYPLQSWVLWRYVRAAVLSVYWASCCIVGGHGVLRRFQRTPLSPGEHLAIAFPVGVFGFFLLQFLLGLLGLIGTASFLLSPLVIALPGARATIRSAKPWSRAWRRRQKLAKGGAAASLIFAFGAVGLGFLYLQTCVPGNLSYDARWYHQTIAEQYAAIGAIRPFREGWFLGAYPHLASVIYSWAHSMPLVPLFDRVMLAVHMEVMLFIGTLWAIPPLVRRLIGRRVPLAWVWLFCFPGIFLYDANLNGSADHVVAFWGCPMVLVLLRALTYRRFYAALLAAFMSAAMLTKYSGTMLVVLPVLALIGSALHALYRFRKSEDKAKRLQGFKILGLVAVAGLLLTTPHWLKNWLWYGNPVYPIAQSHFAHSLWTPESGDRLVHLNPQRFLGTHDLKGLVTAARTMFTFSFLPNNWGSFHGKLPVFGSLFTLGLPTLLVLPKRPRLWLLYAGAHLAVFEWYLVFHLDRYLQAALPWMVAAFAAVAAELWRLGRSTRVGLSLLVALQLVWSADTPVIDTHLMARASVLDRGLAFLRKTRKKTAHNVTRVPHGIPRVMPVNERLAELLPKHAGLLYHNKRRALGLRTRIVSDWIGAQGGLSYVRYTKKDAMYMLMRKHLGVTHVVWTRNQIDALETLGGEVAFQVFLHRHVQERLGMSNMVLGKINATPANNTPYYGKTLALTCQRGYLWGLYETGRMNVTNNAKFRLRSEFPPPNVHLKNAKAVQPMVQKADAVVIDRRCFRHRISLNGFVHVAQGIVGQVWVRGKPIPIKRVPTARRKRRKRR